MFYSGGESDYVVEPVALAEELLQAFDAWENQTKDSEWTDRMQQFLHDKCASLRQARGLADEELEHISTQKKSQLSEFMLDAVWWRRAPNGGKEGLALAMECEWAGARPGVEDRDAKCVGDRVEYDFEKLVAVKSPLKLMIFASAESGGESLKAMQDAIVQRLERLLANRSDHIPGETYILVDAADKANRQAWIWRVRGLDAPVFLTLEQYQKATSPEARIKRIRDAQERARKYLVPGRKIEDELIAERREEARREDLGG